MSLWMVRIRVAEMRSVWFSGRRISRCEVLERSSEKITLKPFPSMNDQITCQLAKKSFTLFTLFTCAVKACHTMANLRFCDKLITNHRKFKNRVPSDPYSRTTRVSHSNMSETNETA